MVNNRTVGSKYEQLAGDFLLKNGIDILEYNYSCKRSEIDIVGNDKGTVIFVEVKYRSDDSYGLPEASVDKRKQGKIKSAALMYLNSHDLYDKVPCRFDVISILGSKITWIKDAF